MPTYAYIATCPAGFEGEAARLLNREWKGALVTRRSGGAIWFSLPFPLDPPSVPDYLSNVFFILREWNTSANPFSELVKQGCRKSGLASLPAGYAPRSFRVRFSRENRFESVDKTVASSAESAIRAATGAVPDRLGSGGEYWFIIRSESWSAFALRLERGTRDTPSPARGELSPALASLVVLRAARDLGAKDGTPFVILDPCAGHGALPERASLFFPEATVIALDIDDSAVKAMKARFSGNPRVSVSAGDLRALEGIDAHSVDLVVADPPWGMWEEGGFREGAGIPELYAAFLGAAARVLKPGGRLGVLTGAKRDFEAAVEGDPVFSAARSADGFRTDILVNGKKAALYLLDA